MLKSKLIKYPRTFNLPWSRSNSSDDVWWKNCDAFEGKEVVVTAKLDGEGSSLYSDHMHARSVDSKHHPSRAWLKRLHASITHQIPLGLRVCGENLYAWHSIFYTNLPTYFFVFGIYDEERCLSWQHTLDYCASLGLQTVPVLYHGMWDESRIRDLAEVETFPTYEAITENPQWPKGFRPTKPEGYVVRLADSFPYEEFKNCCAKYVRENHVQTPQNWMQRKVLPNLLAN